MDDTPLVGRDVRTTGPNGRRTGATKMAVNYTVELDNNGRVKSVEIGEQSGNGIGELSAWRTASDGTCFVVSPSCTWAIRSLGWLIRECGEHDSVADLVELLGESMEDAAATAAETDGFERAAEEREAMAVIVR